MRTARMIAVLGTAGVMATGCGSPGSTHAAPVPVAAPVTQQAVTTTAATTTTVPTAATTAPDPQNPESGAAAAPDAAAPQARTATGLTPQQAAALATAGVLLDTDLSGWTAKPRVRTATDEATDQAMALCIGVPEPDYLYRDSGTDFAAGASTISSSADVSAPAADGADEPGMQSGLDKLPGCLQDDISQRLRGSGVAVTDLSLTPIAARVSGADHSLAIHLVAALAGPRGKITISGDMVFARVGPTEITLSCIGQDEATTLGQITDLAAILTARVHAVEPSRGAAN